MKKLGGSLSISEVQFSFMNLICYFLLMVGKDEFMFINLQLLLWYSYHGGSQVSVSGIDRIDCFLPYAKKDVSLSSTQGFLLSYAVDKRQLSEASQNQHFLKAVLIFGVLFRRTLLRCRKSDRAGEELCAMRRGRAALPTGTLEMGNWRSLASNLLWRPSFWPTRQTMCSHTVQA